MPSRQSHSTLFVIAVVAVSRDDEMVHQMNPHDFTRFPDALSEPVILPAGCEPPRRVVVTDHDARCIAKQGRLQNHPNVSGSFGDASNGDGHPPQHLVIVVEKQHLERFAVLYILVLEGWAKNLVCVTC